MLGPIRLTSALIEHLKKQPRATLIYNTSALAFVPLALTAVYSATKAALHSYVLSQRHKLKATSVSVLEIAPPWVQTDLLNSGKEPRAMPLKDFIEGTVKLLGTETNEILVEQAKAFRNNPGPNESALVTQFNDEMIATAPRRNRRAGRTVKVRSTSNDHKRPRSNARLEISVGRLALAIVSLSRGECPQLLARGLAEFLQGINRRLAALY